MEEVRILGDIIAELLGQGYCLEFEALERCGAEGNGRLAAKGFIVDGVYRCLEYEGAREVMYVFALSSLTLGMKGIVVSMAAAEPAFSLFGRLLRCKTALLRGFRKGGAPVP